MGSYSLSKTKFFMTNIIVWNVCGIGTSHKHLRKMIKKYGISILAISKLFLKEDAIIFFRQMLDSLNLYLDEAKWGKVQLLWGTENYFDVVSVLDQMISSWFILKWTKVFVTLCMLNALTMSVEVWQIQKNFWLGCNLGFLWGILITFEKTVKERNGASLGL